MSTTHEAPTTPTPHDPRVAFPSWVTHDLRQPLVQLVGFADLLSRRCTDERQLGWLVNMQHASAQLDRMIDNLGQLAAATTERPLGDPGDLDLERTLSEVVDLCRERVPGAGEAQVVVDTRGMNDRTLRAPERTFSTIAQQLIANALEHAMESPVTITARWNAPDEPDEAFALRVDNVGEAVPAEIESIMFEPFVRGGDPGRGRLGLGLAIARANATRLNGSVMMSRHGEVTSFTVEIATNTPRPPPPRGANPPI